MNKYSREYFNTQLTSSPRVGQRYIVSLFRLGRCYFIIKYISGYSRAMTTPRRPTIENVPRALTKSYQESSASLPFTSVYLWTSRRFSDGVSSRSQGEVYFGVAMGGSLLTRNILTGVIPSVSFLAFFSSFRNRCQITC